MVARLLATAALWVSNPDISQKYKIGDMSKGVADTLARKKNIQKSSLKQEVKKKIWGGGLGLIWLP